MGRAEDERKRISMEMMGVRTGVSDNVHSPGGKTARGWTPDLTRARRAEMDSSVHFCLRPVSASDCCMCYAYAFVVVYLVECV